ncbi:MAG: type II toxin-antitoxin system PemK/MazF family toxin [Gemmatimonadota bacterium]|nr:type II toxin-antitoxin system PemK/MazF family toxin [Gemmatimonadota bacterium]
MVTPAIGSVVLVTFPFSDLSQSKRRPAVVLADVGRGDWILCQITSNSYGDSEAITLTDASVDTVSVLMASYARPRKRFAASSILMVRQVGTLKADMLKQIVETVINILRAGLTS